MMAWLNYCNQVLSALTQSQFLSPLHSKLIQHFVPCSAVSVTLPICNGCGGTDQDSEGTAKL